MIDLAEWYWVYPRGDKLELTDKVEPVAVFRNEATAIQFTKERWPTTGEVHQGGISNNRGKARQRHERAGK